MRRGRCFRLRLRLVYCDARWVDGVVVLCSGGKIKMRYCRCDCRHCRKMDIRLVFGLSDSSCACLTRVPSSVHRLNLFDRICRIIHVFILSIVRIRKSRVKRQQDSSGSRTKSPAPKNYFSSFAPLSESAEIQCASLFTSKQASAATRSAPSSGR